LMHASVQIEMLAFHFDLENGRMVRIEGWIWFSCGL